MLGVVHVIKLYRRGAIWTFAAGQRALKNDRPAARIAAQFALPGLIMPVVFMMLAHASQHALKAVLIDAGVFFAKLQRFFESAERTRQILLPDMELKIGSAALTGKDSSLATINFVTGF